METIPITVVEVHPFPVRADDVWSDAERLEFIDFIARHPLAGDEIVGTGGLRKIRWGRQGKGKRGGVRIIYFFYNESAPIFLLTVYPKSQREDLTSEERKKLAVLAKDLKSRLKRQE